MTFTDDAVDPEYRHVAGTCYYEIDIVSRTLSLQIVTAEEASIKSK